MGKFQQFLEETRLSATKWAQTQLSADPQEWAILDTETTGMGEFDQVVQIGIIDGAGNRIMDNVLIKPTVFITPGAFAVHRIASFMLDGAPSFADILPVFSEAVLHRQLVIYNAAFDLRILRQSAHAHGLPSGLNIPHTCAMLKYAEWAGDWSERHGNFRWQRLTGGDHTAIGDCLATLNVIKRMAGVLDG